MAFERNKQDSEFSILICHLQDVPRTEQQLMSAGINSRDYEQVDFENKYDLGAAASPNFRRTRYPKGPECASIISTVQEGGQPRAELGNLCYLTCNM